MTLGRADELGLGLMSAGGIVRVDSIGIEVRDLGVMREEKFVGGRLESGTGKKDDSRV